ncbi:MAG: hypothetical protein ABJG47_08020 [Ekhidna sp.]
MRLGLFILWMAISISVLSQIKKGVRFVESGVTYDLDKSVIETALFNDSKFRRRYYKLFVGAGYAIRQNHLLSLDFVARSEKNTSLHGSPIWADAQNAFLKEEKKETLFGIRMGYEYYFQFTNKIFISSFISASVGMGSFSREILDVASHGDILEYDFTLTPRVQYIIKNWSIMISYGMVQYFNRKTTFEEGTTRGPNPLKENDFRADLGLRSLSLGVRYYLNNSQE